MANSSQISGSLSASVGGSSSSASFSGQYDMTGDKAPLNQQTATTTPTALELGSAANIGTLLLKVLTGTGTQHVVVSLDAAGLQVVSDIPEGLGIILVKPPTTLYVAVNATTILIEYKITEQ